MEVDVLNGWRPREYQMQAWGALEAGYKRLALAWHRRSGKDDIALHWAAVAAATRVGPYWHMLPEAAQARKSIWDAVNPNTGRRRIDDAFPLAMRSSTRESDMFIRFVNGSTWQVVGSDNYNSLIGSPPVGIVYSEYALSNPSAWDYLRPILLENDGWAIFISTVRGRNHFTRMLDWASSNPETWFGQRLTVDDTGVITPAQIADERRELHVTRGVKEGDALIAQEYFCDADASIPGSYYGELMSDAMTTGRIGLFPHIPSLPVGTAWDLGHGDQTVVWCYQQLPNGRVRLIDVIEGSGVGIDWYVRKLLQLPYTYVDHIWPHDGGHGNIRDIGNTSLKANASALGLNPIRILDRDLEVDWGINAVRQMLPLCEFNSEPMVHPAETPDQARARMERALDAMRQYHKKWDEARKRYSDKPDHDWCSDTADAMRYLARGRMPHSSGHSDADVSAFRKILGYA